MPGDRDLSADRDVASDPGVAPASPAEGRRSPPPRGAGPADGSTPRGEPESGGPGRHFQRFNLGTLLLITLLVLFVRDAWTVSSDVTELPYSEFLALLEEDAIADVVVSADQVQGRFKEERDGKSRFVTTRVDPDLAETLRDHGVEVRGRTEDVWLPMLLSWVLPVLLFVGVWMFLLRRMGRGGGPGAGFMSVGKSKAKIYVEHETGVDFSHVAGVDEAKQELQEIVSFLKEPESYGRLGARMPKGVLLVGPPGTGKTLMARAVAGEAGVAFFSISGSEFVEMFVGVGAARVRDLFEQARSKAPCIIFIDELDALGRARSAQPGVGSHDEKEQTLNQLLVELDGFDPSSGIVILAATNRPEILDPALLRAGRFDRQVLLDRPDKNGRAAILVVHMGKVTLGPDVDAEKVAALTPGFTGADLANLVNEAALVATRRGADAVEMDDFTMAIERIVAGLEKRNRLLNPKEREVVAHHEMGHALVAAALPGVDEVHKVSIIPRGIGALGYTLQRPTDDRYLMTRTELENRMTVLLGGRAAEHLVFGHLSTGASDDLAKATDIARAMVTRYAMIPELGHASLEDAPSPFLGPIAAPQVPMRRYSEQTAREIDCAVRDLVDRAFERARGLLERHRDVLHDAAAELLEEETLTEDDLDPFFVRVRGTAKREGGLDAEGAPEGDAVAGDADADGGTVPGGGDADADGEGAAPGGGDADADGEGTAPGGGDADAARDAESASSRHVD